MRLALLAIALAAGAGAQQPRLLAVLELRNKPPPSSLGRTGIRIISRENLLVLLQSSGKRIEDCEGECEVDTGKRIGADYVISGELVMVGSTVKASLRLHDTHEGTLLAAITASGRTPEELDKNLSDTMPKLLAPLKKIAPSAPAPAPKVEKSGKPAPFVV